MNRQKIRKTFITVSLLLFPITLYYFSPALIINAGLNGVINGSFIIFVLMFLLSILFGRFFCAYLCPAGGLQECAFAINDKKPKQGWKNNIKYIIWNIWLSAVVFCYFHSEKIVAVDFLFETENGVSVSSIQSYIIYYGIVLLIFIPSVLFGKRVFCHYFCWMAPFMVIGTKFRRLLHLPGLHIKVKEKIYTITDDGRRYLKEWLKMPAEKDELRYETLLKLFFGNEEGVSQAILHIETFQEKIEKEMLYLLGAEKSLKEIIDDDATHKYYLLTVKFGIKTYRAYLDWCKEANELLTKNGE